MQTAHLHGSPSGRHPPAPCVHHEAAQGNVAAATDASSDIPGLPSLTPADGRVPSCPQPFTELATAQSNASPRAAAMEGEATVAPIEMPVEPSLQLVNEPVVSCTAQEVSALSEMEAAEADASSAEAAIAAGNHSTLLNHGQAGIADAAVSAGRCSSALTYVQDSEDEELDPVPTPSSLHAAAALDSKAVGSKHGAPAIHLNTQAALSRHPPAATEADLATSQHDGFPASTSGPCQMEVEGLLHGSSLPKKRARVSELHRGESAAIGQGKRHKQGINNPLSSHSEAQASALLDHQPLMTNLRSGSQFAAPGSLPPVALSCQLSP